MSETKTPRICAECGVPIFRGDGGIVVQGVLFCSDICAEERDAPGTMTSRDLEDWEQYW